MAELLNFKTEAESKGLSTVNLRFRTFLLRAGRIRTLLLCVLFGLVSTAASARQNGAITWWIAHATLKVRPADAPPKVLGHEAELRAARNEFEAFQIVLRAPREIGGIDVEVSDLSDAAGHKIPAGAIQVYLVGTLAIDRPSRQSGVKGEWPDPLIPRVDSFYREKRNSFPFTLAAQRNQSVWIDVYVPQSQAAGAYRGVARVTTNGASAFDVPIKLQVWNFELPSTSSLPTSFGFSGILALKQHAGAYTSDSDVRKFTNLYARAALLDRISLHGGSQIPPPFTPGKTEAETTIDWREYDLEMAPFLDGSALGASSPLPGARYTSIDLRTHGGANTDAKKAAYWKEWARHFRQRGWLDRLFYYVKDEPAVSDFPEITRLATLAHKADPQIRTLVTTARTPALGGLIDIWTPLINCFEIKTGFDGFCRETVPRASYDEDIRAGRRLWWYQSCGSHGCNIPGGAYFDGWPSYMVDDSAVSNRVMPWLAWKYHIAGELYFNVNEAYGKPKDPWTDLYLFGGNGDGTLFYPGRTARIGGAHDIPIESVRLKLIREGLEDYEYFRLMGSAADAHVNRIVQGLYRYEPNPETLYAARAQMGDLIAAAPRSVRGDRR